MATVRPPDPAPVSLYASRMFAGVLPDAGGVAASGEVTGRPSASTSLRAWQLASPALASVQTRCPWAPGTASAVLAAPTAPTVSPMAAVTVATTLARVLRIWGLLMARR